MYNTTFDLYIASTMPYSEGEGEQMKTGINIVGIVRSQKKEFLDDLNLGDNKPGLATVLAQGLPIAYPVKLKFTPHADTTLSLENGKDVACTLKTVRVHLPNEEDLIDLELRVTLEDLDADTIGSIVSMLKSTAKAFIKSTQLQLFS